MIYYLDATYSEDDCCAALEYSGPGDEPRYCGEEKDGDEFDGMLAFSEGNRCDFIYISPGVMACSEKIGSLLKEEVPSDEIQLLPIHVQGMNMFVINVTRLLDVLDQNQSTIKPLPDGRMLLDPCVIDEGKVPESIYFFKIPECACSAVFGTERLKRLLETTEFTGLQFCKDY